MRKRIIFIVLGIVAVATTVQPAGAGDRLRIGVTLHTYYSWVANIVGDQAEAIPVIPADFDPHTYQPRKEDLSALATLDGLVINGAGHDSFIEPMLAAAGREDLRLIRPMDSVPTLPTAGLLPAKSNDGPGADSVNSHAYLSINAGAPQIFAIARELGELDPERAAVYMDNARAYVKRLRWLLARALSEIGRTDLTDVRIATVHDGYSYLFQELGLEVAAVIQPRHGIEPSARQLADTVERLKAARVELLFTEMDFPQRVVNVVREETGVRLFKLTHISKGDYSAEKFETGMAMNYANILAALRVRTKIRRQR